MSDPARTWDASAQATFDAAVKRADAGDRAVLPVIKQTFDDLFPDIWDAYGDLATIAENALIELMAGDSALTSEGLRRKVAAMREELAGREASPLERLLVERVVACWLQSYHADLMSTRSLAHSASDEAERYQRRQDRAARQYLKALRSLAVVRRLLVPMVQLNVAERQVNIAGPGVSARKERRELGG